MHATPAIVMQVFRNIGKLGEMTESPYYGFSGLVAELIEHHVKLVPRFKILLAAESDGGLTNVLNKLKSGFTFLLTQRIAQHPAQQPDIFTQRVIFQMGVFIHGLILATVFALRSKRRHSATFSGKGMLCEVV